MSGLLDQSVDWRELSEVEKQYHSEIRENRLSVETKFTYAQKLVKSQYQADILKGLRLFDEILSKQPVQVDVDEAYHSLALGYGRIGDYKTGLFFLRLSSERCPGRDELEEVLKSKLERDGWIGVGIVAGVSIITAALIAYAYKKMKK